MFLISLFNPQPKTTSLPYFVAYFGPIWTHHSQSCHRSVCTHHRFLVLVFISRGWQRPNTALSGGEIDEGRPADLALASRGRTSTTSSLLRRASALGLGDGAARESARHAATATVLLIAGGKLEGKKASHCTRAKEYRNLWQSSSAFPLSCELPC